MKRQYSKLHKIDGPHFIRNDGIGIWYVNGLRMDSWEQLQYEANLSNEEILALALIWGDKGPQPFTPIETSNIRK